jgi:DNA-binding HxlR family transcriptional regulator
MSEKNSCPVQKALDIIGGKWKLVILHYLKDGEAIRFKELERRIGGISPRMLVKELKDLEAHGILKREQFATIPPAVEYSITEHGRSLLPVLEAVSNWGQNH